MNEKETKKRIRQINKDFRQKNPLLTSVRSHKERDQKYLDIAEELGIRSDSAQFDRMCQMMKPLPGLRIMHPVGDRWQTKAARQYQQKWRDWNTLAVVAKMAHTKKCTPSAAAEFCGTPKDTLSRARKRHPDQWRAFEENSSTCHDFIECYKGIQAETKTGGSIGRMNAHQALSKMRELGSDEETWFKQHQAEQKKLTDRLRDDYLYHLDWAEKEERAYQLKYRKRI